VRILVVTQYFWPEDFRINELVAELVARGHEVTVLTGKPNYPDGRLFAEFIERPESFASYLGARVVRVPIWPRGTRKLSLGLNYLSYAVSATVLGVFRLRSARYDAILVFGTSPVTAGIPAIVLRRIRGWPTAFWVLDQWPESLSAVGVLQSKVLLRQVGRLVSFIYTRCDLLLASSKALIPLIARYSTDKAPIEYFPNWVESTYRGLPPEPASEIPLSDRQFSVMFAGNIGDAQDFPAVLDAAEELKGHSNIRWLIVGDGRRASWVKAEIEKRGLKGSFLLVGRYPPDRMPSFYRHANALLVSLRPDPIFSMTVPGKIQSYLACGIPIIGMLDGEGARVIQDAGAGLTCSAGHSRGLANCVLRMSNMTENELSSMGRNGQAYAKKEFDRDRLVGALESMLSSLHAAGDLPAGGMASVSA
jgi:colanic acid biosynthesis glycosyl transferase WcaI